MCDILCFLAVIGVIAYIISMIVESNNKAEEREKEERERRERNKREKERAKEKAVVNVWESIRKFLIWEQNYYKTGKTEIYNYAIPSIKILEGQQKVEAQSMINEFVTLGKRQTDLSDNNMMNSGEYGKVNKIYLTSIERLMQRDRAEQIVQEYREIIDDVDYDNFKKINMNELLKAVWFFALEPRFSSEFDDAKKVFCRISKKRNFDIIVADLYVKNKTGGEDALRDTIQKILKFEGKGELKNKLLTIVASSLMWMKAYKSENTVLQYMLTNEMKMTPKMRQRLHDLSKGGKSPEQYTKTSSNEEIYFDVSVLTWNEEDYIGLFDNFAFQEKVLTYSLAVRDEDKELFVTKEINVPSLQEIEGKLGQVFEHEYGDMVESKIVNGEGLSGSGEEKMMGILISSKECEPLAIFTYFVKIGKKLNIKFYTLFMPKEQKLEKQRQQVLSLYKKLSPAVSMWESSLKDTTLLAIQQLLNVESGNVQNTNNVINETVTIDNDKPVF